MSSIWRCPKCGARTQGDASRCAKDGTPLIRLGSVQWLGRKIGGYEIEDALGCGGMAEVYRAKSEYGTVALKVLNPISTKWVLARRFQLESDVARRFRHPHVLDVYDAGITDGGVRFIAMELLEGKTLADELRASGALPARRVREITRQLATGLDAVHAQGIVHRDLKPANIALVDAGSKNEVAKILDFGVATLTGPEGDERTQLTNTGMFVGTPSFMAPEQFGPDQLTPAADMYSLGVVLYSMLAGRTPWQGTGTKLLAARLTQKEPPLAPPSEGLEKLARRLMSWVPADRPTARDVAVWLDSGLEEDATSGDARTEVRSRENLQDSIPPLPMGSDWLDAGEGAKTELPAEDSTRAFAPTPQSTLSIVVGSKVEAKRTVGGQVPIQAGAPMDGKAGGLGAQAPRESTKRRPHVQDTAPEPMLPKPPSASRTFARPADLPPPRSLTPERSKSDPTAWMLRALLAVGIAALVLLASRILPR